MLFKADWCGHCVKFKPIWDTLSKTYEKEFNMRMKSKYGVVL